MTRRARKTLFYVLVCLFLVVGSGVVLYAQGWRISFTTWHPEKVGGIFVRAYPENADITLNGKAMRNEAGILSHGTLISNLFPRTYTLGLQESGYDDWHESVTAYPSMVTELKYAVLVPNNPTTIASGTITEFSLVSDEMVLEAAGGAVTWRGVAIGKGNIISASQSFGDVLIKNATTGVDSLYDFDAATSTNLSALFTKNGINAGALTSVAIDPTDATKIIAGNGRGIWMYDTALKSLSLVARAATGTALGPAIAASPSRLAWAAGVNASGTSEIVVYDKFAKTSVTSSATIPGENLSLAWITSRTLGVLQSDGSLYLYDTSAGTSQKIADDVKSFEATSDGSLLAAIEGHSMEIFPFTSANTYHRFNLPDIGNVTGVIWYKDMDHLFVVYRDHVSFLDLQDAGLSNFTTVAQGSQPYYDPQENELALIDPGGQLVQFSFPN